MFLVSLVSLLRDFVNSNLLHSTIRADRSLVITLRVVSVTESVFGEIKRASVDVLRATNRALVARSHLVIPRALKSPVKVEYKLTQSTE